MESVSEIHISVLGDEAVEFLNPVPGGLYLDCTLGLGGHTELILQRSKPDGRVIAFEWDVEALEKAQVRLSRFAGRLQILRRNFSEVQEGLESIGVTLVDGIIADVGLSSLQLDRGRRGFSFRRDELLDMRMDNRRQLTAADLLDKASQEELADIFYYYGEERQARPIAAAIADRRRIQKIETTGQLAELVSEVIPKRFHPKKIHVATKVFQALRVAVNEELENLSFLLERAVRYLKPGGRFCVIAFNSLEDRIVKSHFKSCEKLKILTKKPVVPGEGEIRSNPRSRSARLRVAEKLTE
ncbi:MAG: 16S rRNA (cytosine(1402)-N(4))-methyltransferase [Deltaproteobacteria bacterium]|nr:MAG: 16S rRNA (cytosine(1402)-N(4))-methyltransferase [Deltaproteobacteria bacterium]PIE72970.1 MAG: 16S rRNA (cytosine(1402)-N(4))-methyltransferase [Deltaproteobacteria bacterium]